MAQSATYEWTVVCLSVCLYPVCVLLVQRGYWSVQPRRYRAGGSARGYSGMREPATATAAAASVPAVRIVLPK